MKSRYALVLLLAAAAPMPLAAQEAHATHAEVPPRVALMSAEVLQRRFEMLGYTNVRVVAVEGRAAQVEAVRDGRPVRLSVDRAEWKVSPAGRPAVTQPPAQQAPRAEPPRQPGPVTVPSDRIRRDTAVVAPRPPGS